MLCPAAGEDSGAWPGLRLGPVLPTAGSSSLSCNALLLSGFIAWHVNCMCRRKLGSVLGGTKKPLTGWIEAKLSFCVLCSGLQHRVFGEVVTANDVPGEGSTRLQHPSWSCLQRRCYFRVCLYYRRAWCALILEKSLIVGFRLEKQMSVTSD